MKAEEFLREKELEVENLFKDWHIEKLASVLDEYAELKLQEYKDTLEEIKQRTKKIT